MGPNRIPQRQLGLGRGRPMVSSIGLGTMAIGALYGKTNMEKAYQALTYAADRGMTFWDCADVYGSTERTLGKWFAETGRRSEIFLATKFGGWDPDGEFGVAISTPSHIRKSLERSLRELGTDYIDLYYQHRVDRNVPIEIVMETLREPLEKGVIRWIGLSECNADTLKRARAVKGVGEKIIAAQMEFSPFSLDVVRDGFVEAAKEAGISLVAYSPLGRGMVTGQYRSRADFDPDDYRLLIPRFSEENFSKNLVLADKIKAIADRYGATPSQVTLAWILAMDENYIPIPGCRSAERVEENARGAEIQLTRDDVDAIKKLSEEADIVGARYAEVHMAITEGWCISLEEYKGEMP